MAPKFSGYPVVLSNAALNPWVVFFFSTMLMIPAIPSASYRADGLVMISTLSIRFPCKPANPPPLIPTIVDGFPSTKIRTFSLPLSLTPPSPSTWTEGKLPKISAAVAPLLAKSVPTLNIRLSKASSILAFCPFTVTSAKVLVLDLILIVPKLTLDFSFESI